MERGHAHKELEGSWLGSDKAAHVMVSPLVTYVGLHYIPEYAWQMWGLSILLSMAWEASNYWYVLQGTRGVSAKDLVAFLAGGVWSFIAVWIG